MNVSKIKPEESKNLNLINWPENLLSPRILAVDNVEAF